jgi:biopolymer transport protein ExbB/TolQ
MTNDSLCPECGASHGEDFVRCPACHAFLVDASPWKSNTVLYAVPIALLLWLVFMGLAYFAALKTDIALATDPISQTIVGLAIYGLVVVFFKWHVTSRQTQAFKIVQRCCTRASAIDDVAVSNARRQLAASGRTDAFNTSVAYNRLRLLGQIVAARRSNAHDGLLEAMRQHADADREALDNSFASTQFLIWLLPTAGFLGTVYGMTQALQSFSAVVGTTTNEFGLAGSLTDTTQSLGIAFHTTLVGLATVIPLLAFNTALRRRSQALLEQMDKFFLRLATYTVYVADSVEAPQANTPDVVPKPIPVLSEAGFERNKALSGLFGIVPVPLSSSAESTSLSTSSPPAPDEISPET